MNLRQLEAFRATLRGGSITEAANMLNISQPSVSRLISDLERSVGFKLFLRLGRGVTPTVECQQFYRGVEQMFFGIDRLDDLARSIRTSQGGTISIGTIQSLAAIELPAAVGRMYQNNPEVAFIIHSRNTPGILEAIQIRQMDLGIVGRDAEHSGVETLFQASAPYVCLFPEDHDLATLPGPVDLNEIAESENFVTFGGAYPDAMLSIDSALSKKLQNRSRLSAANLPVAGALVREAGVLAIADPFSAELAVRMGGVVFRPITQALTYHIAIIAAGREYLPRHALDFVEILSAQIQTRVESVARYTKKA